MLYTRCNPEDLRFQTTADITDGPEIIGQPRAVESIRFGVGLAHEGYNIFALGPVGTGKRFLVEHFLHQESQRRPVPSDICYINNFVDSNKPKLLRLPPGMAVALKQDIVHLMDEVSGALPAAFESEELQARVQALKEEFGGIPAKHLDELRERAKELSLAMLQSPVGIVFAPTRKGEAISSEDFAKLSRKEQEEVQHNISMLQDELQKILRQVPRWERELRDKIRDAHREVAASAIGHAIDDVRERYKTLPEVEEYMDDLRADMLEHAKDFVELLESHDK
jgi:hypothetical protein